MSSPDIVGMLENCRDLDRLRKAQEEVLLEINKMHKKLQATPEVVEKPGDAYLAKLKQLYIQAKELSESEVNISNTLLGQLDTLLPSVPPGQRRKSNMVKRKRVKADHDISIVQNHIELCASLEGEEVAARVTADDAADHSWFVVKVINFDKETKEFEVVDEDDEEAGGKRNYRLPISCIIPFPKPNGPLGVPEFPPGKRVLAVYPGTTTLYKATVISSPRKRKLNDYLLEFDDEEKEAPQKTVPFDRVIALPEGHRP